MRASRLKSLVDRSRDLCLLMCINSKNVYAYTLCSCMWEKSLCSAFDLSRIVLSDSWKL